MVAACVGGTHPSAARLRCRLTRQPFERGGDTSAEGRVLSRQRRRGLAGRRKKGQVVDKEHASQRRSLPHRPAHLDQRFTDLHQWVTELPDFAADSKKSNERILEAIQMAWYDEWQSEYGEG